METIILQCKLKTDGKLDAQKNETNEMEAN